MNDCLIVYYSHTGYARRLAQMLASESGWPTGEVREDEPRAGAWGTLRCVLDSLLRRKPEITYLGPLPGGFRTVILVAPIWMYQLAGPMRSFVATHHAQLGRVALLNTMGSRGAVNAVAEVARLLDGHPLVLATAVTARQVEDGSASQKVRDVIARLAPDMPVENMHRPADLSPNAT